MFLFESIFQKSFLFSVDHLAQRGNPTKEFDKQEISTTNSNQILLVFHLELYKNCAVQSRANIEYSIKPIINLYSQKVLQDNGKYLFKEKWNL